VAVFLVMTSMAAMAQVQITGHVKDASTKEAIDGVGVVVPGSTITATTHNDGKFSILVPEDAQKLVFKIIGYVDDTVMINNRTVIDVQMSQSAQKIDDLVFIGYGAVKRSDLTGAVTSVKINDTEASSTDSFDRLLQGRAAGVQVVNTSGAPGGVSEITIRGASTFSAGATEPLYVVDGIILNPASQDARGVFSTGGGTGDAGVQEKQNALAAINPSDILSMEVLKDASATAIYGSQGANGVVIITTKSGTTAKAKIDFNASMQFSTPTKYLPQLSKNEWSQWQSEAKPKGNNFDPDTTQGMDWQRYSMRQAFSQIYRLSVSGNTDDTKYYFSGSLNKTSGIMFNSGINLSTFRINVEKKINKVITVGTASNFSYSSNQMTSQGNSDGTANKAITKQMLVYHPYTAPKDIYDPNSDEGDNIAQSPISWRYSYQDNRNEWRATPSLYANLYLLKWLTFRSMLGGDYRRQLVGRSNGQGLYSGDTNGGRAGITTLGALSWNWDNTFSINKTFGPGGAHSLQGTLGMSMNSKMQQSYQVQSSLFGTSLTDPNWRTAMRWGPEALYLGTQVDVQASNYDESLYNLLSYYARAVYGYKGRYTLTATIRADGSSKFKGSNQFSWFPSFAFAWKADQETFIKKVRWINQLKLRLGWGETGNQGSVAPYQTLFTYSSTPYMIGTTGWMPPNGTTTGLKTGYNLSGIANPTLKWETSEQYNVGLDFSAFNNRVNFTMDIYRKNTWDLLQNMPLPQSSGPGANMYVNRGGIRNDGIELSLDLTPIQTQSFRLAIGGNISFNRNVITDTGQPYGWMGTNYWSAFQGGTVGSGNTNISLPVNIFIKGKPMGLFYGLKTNGIIQAGEVGPSQGSNASMPGFPRFVDQNGDGVIDDGDYVIIGDPNPKFTGGFYLSMTYKNLSLDVNFNGTYGNDVFNGNYVTELRVGVAGNTPTNNIRSEAYYEAWRPDAPTNGRYPGLGQSPDPNIVPDTFIEDGSFLRLSNISLAWRIPLQKKLGWITAVSLSLSGRNLWLLTNYPGWDPEVNSFAFNPLIRGVDWSSYPGSKAIIFGIGLTF